MEIPWDGIIFGASHMLAAAITCMVIIAMMVVFGLALRAFLRWAFGKTTIP